MANPVIGYVNCAHCGELSTVHRESRGMRVMYYRCYGEDGMSMRCGTVQIRGPSGQVWISENMRGGPEIHGKENAAVRAAKKVVEVPAETPTRRKRSLLDLIGVGADDE